MSRENPTEDWKALGFESLEAFKRYIENEIRMRRLPTRAPFSVFRRKTLYTGDGFKSNSEIETRYAGTPELHIEEGHESDPEWKYPVMYERASAGIDPNDPRVVSQAEFVSARRALLAT